MSSDTRETIAVLSLAVVAAATVVQALVTLRLALATRDAAERAAILGVELREELRHGMSHVKRVADDVGAVSEQALQQLERVEHVLDWSVESGRKAKDTAARLLWPPLKLAAVYKGMKHGLAFYRARRAQSSATPAATPAEGEEPRT